MSDFNAMYSDGDVDTNNSGNRPLHAVIGERYSRRQTIRGGLMATSTAFLGTALLAACDDDAPDRSGNVSVNAGDALSTSSGRAVTIDGTLLGTGGTIAWTQTGGPEVSLTGANTARPSFIAPAVAAATALTFSATATGTNGNQSFDTTTVNVSPAQLGFAAVAKNLADVVTVPAGYTVTVMTRLGDPIAPGVAPYRNDGTDTDFARRVGDQGDALAWFGLDAAGAGNDASSTRGLVAQNHENLVIQYLHPNGPTNGATGPRPPAEVDKEIDAHGVSVVEYADAGNRTWAYVRASTFNRRITPNTPVVFNGPVRGTDFLKTVGNPAGTGGTRTINNCADGLTGWATLLTCEENWAGYFRRDNSGPGTDNGSRTPAELVALRRYGVSSSRGNNAWSTAGIAPQYARWDARATGASFLADYRNEPNTMGWVVEIDSLRPGQHAQEAHRARPHGPRGRVARPPDRRAESRGLYGRRCARRISLQIRLHRRVGCRRRRRGEPPCDRRPVPRRRHALRCQIQSGRLRRVAAAHTR